MSYQAVTGQQSADPELLVMVAGGGAACGSYPGSSLQQVEAVAGQVDNPEPWGLRVLRRGRGRPPGLVA